MLVKVNGYEEQINTSTTLEQLLAAKNLEVAGIIVLHNDNVVNREELSKIILQDSDVIEILRFLGGG